MTIDVDTRYIRRRAGCSVHARSRRELICGGNTQDALSHRGVIRRRESSVCRGRPLRSIGSTSHSPPTNRLRAGIPSFEAEMKLRPHIA